MKTSTKTLNIRLYKVIFPSGEIGFETKSEDTVACSGFRTIKDAASLIKSEIKNFFMKESNSNVSIDLKPYHDFEIHSDLAPRKCLAFSPEESDEFWKEYLYLKD